MAAPRPAPAPVAVPAPSPAPAAAGDPSPPRRRWGLLRVMLTLVLGLWAVRLSASAVRVAVDLANRMPATGWQLWPGEVAPREHRYWSYTAEQVMYQTAATLPADPIEPKLREAFIRHAESLVLSPVFWGVLRDDAVRAGGLGVAPRLTQRVERATHREWILGDTMPCFPCLVLDREWPSKGLDSSRLPQGFVLGSLWFRDEARTIITTMTAPSVNRAQVAAAKDSIAILQGRVESIVSQWRGSILPPDLVRQRAVRLMRWVARAEVTVDAAECRLRRQSCPLLRDVARELSRAAQFAHADPRERIQ